MAIAAVAATKLAANSGTSVTAAVSATAGNALLVSMNAYNGVSMTVTRTGDTYTTDTNGATAGAVDFQRVGIASAPNVAGGSVNMTVAGGTGTSGVVAFAMEFSGLATSSIRDATSPAIKTASSTSATSNSLTNATADAVYVVAVGSESGANPVTITATGSWTGAIGATTMTETNGTIRPCGGGAYQIVASAAARNGAWTVTNAQWGAVAAVYKMAAAGGSVAARRLPVLGVG